MLNALGNIPEVTTKHKLEITTSIIKNEQNFNVFCTQSRYRDGHVSKKY